MYQARHKYSAVKAFARDNGGWKALTACALMWSGFWFIICAATFM